MTYNFIRSQNYCSYIIGRKSEDQGGEEISSRSQNQHVATLASNPRSALFRIPCAQLALLYFPPPSV